MDGLNSELSITQLLRECWDHFDLYTALDNASKVLKGL